MHVVADASLLIALAQVDAFHLLRDLFDSIEVPQDVYDEVVAEGQGRPGAAELAQAVADGWAVVVPGVVPSAATGEEAVLGWGQVRQQAGEPVVLLFDDPSPRTRAAHLGLPAMGTGVSWCWPRSVAIWYAFSRFWTG